MPEAGSRSRRRRSSQRALRDPRGWPSSALSFDRATRAGTSARSIRVGIPRVLNIYSTAPWFRTYFEALGIQKQNVVFSDETTEEMWVEGGKYGSIDPCYPSKVAQAHIHNLLFHHHEPAEKKPLHYIFFPILTHVTLVRERHDGQRELPDRRRRARRHEGGVHQGDRLLRRRAASSTSTRRSSMIEPTLLARRMFEVFGPAARASPRTRTTHACREAWKALDHLRARPAGQGARHPRDRRGREPRRHPDDRPAVPLRSGAEPRHPRRVPGARLPDPLDALDPQDPRVPRSLLQGRARQAGSIKTPLEINDVWPENYSANSAQKVWAAKFAARHPNVVVLDLSSFKCGHDAPTYGLIDSIIDASTTPYAALHDIDANKPGGSIKIRVKTYAHSLKLHEERLEDSAAAKDELTQRASTRSGSSSSSSSRASSTRVEADRSGAGARRSRSSPPRSKRRTQAAQERRRAADGASFSSDKKREDGTVVRVAGHDLNGRTNVSQATIDTLHGTERQTKPLRADQPKKARRRSLGDVDVDAELAQVRGRESARASGSSRAREQWVDDDGQRAVHRGRARPHVRCSSRASPWRTTYLIEGGAARASATTCSTLECPTTTRSSFGKEFGNRGQCNPTYFTVGNLVKYLVHLRDEQGMTRRGHRQELRLRDRRRVRPVPLRHVRHRVPQGAARRRLRRLPRACSSSRRAASRRRPATTSASR